VQALSAGSIELVRTCAIACWASSCLRVAALAADRLLCSVLLARRPSKRPGGVRERRAFGGSTPYPREQSPMNGVNQTVRRMNSLSEGLFRT
jgi:hypothetical protein